MASGNESAVAVVSVRSPELRRALDAVSGGINIRRVLSLEAALDVAAVTRAAYIVYEAGGHAHDPERFRGSTRRTMANECPIGIVLGAHRQSFADFAQLCALALELYECPMFACDAGRFLQRLQEGTIESTPTVPILRVALARDGSFRDTLLTAAIVLGARKHRVGVLASSLGLSSRSLTEQLRRCGLPTAVCLLAWSAALHAAWRIEVLNQRVGWSASAAGMGSARQLHRLMRRWTGHSPSHLRTGVRFADLLDAFLQLLGAQSGKRFDRDALILAPCTARAEPRAAIV